MLKEFRLQSGLVMTIFGMIVLLNMPGYASSSSDGFHVKVNIEGISDTVLYMANYYGDKTYLTDTAFRDKKGRFVFEADTMLPAGIYILAGQSNNKYLEFIMDHNQRFEISTSLKGLPTKINFKNSPENTLFLSYINESIHVRKASDSLRKIIGKRELSEDSLSMINHKMVLLKDSLDTFQKEIIEKHGDSYVAAILRAMQDTPELHESDFNDGTYDTIQAYQYYKNHYFDNIDLSDARMLRTPLYHRLVSNYFNKVLYQQTDTIIREADRIISLARPNRETFKYVIWYLTYTFESSKIMGFDEIFVHMVDNYYAKGLAYWADFSVVKSLMKRADELRNILVGHVAPNMILLDTLGTFKSLYQIKSKYVIVLFYEPDCAHCRSEIKELNNWIPENPLDVKVYAVCADTSISKWKKFIKKNKLDWIHVNGTRTVTADYHKLYDIKTTPTIYLLDEKKTIIAKQLKSDQLFPFILNYDKRNSTSESIKREP